MMPMKLQFSYLLNVVVILWAMGALTPCLVRAQVVYESNPNVAVPDYPAPPFQDELVAPDGYIIGDLNVSLVILHPWVGDISVSLMHDATTVMLLHRPGVPASFFGCSHDNYDIVLDDEGTGGSIEALCSAGMTSPPNYVPMESLASFAGMEAGGAWTLTITEHAGSQAYATLLSWGLSITPQGCSGCRLYGDIGEPFCTIDLNDLLVVLAGFLDPLLHPEADVAPCGGDAEIDVGDVLAVLDAFSGVFSCLHPCPG